MGKVTGFMEFERLEQAHEPVAQRKTHFRDFITPLSQQEAKQQAARCMDCGTPFCTFSCPLHNVAPEFNDLVYNEDWEKAYHVLSSTNNFPEFTSRVCPALCENGCIMNYTQRAMGVKSIERAIITNAWNQGWVKPEPPKEHKDKSVAVVGSDSPVRSSWLAWATPSRCLKRTNAPAVCSATASLTSSWIRV